jgi:hypothetical protein
MSFHSNRIDKDKVSFSKKDLIKKSKKKYFRRKIIYFFIYFLLLTFLLFGFLNLNIFKLKDINITGNINIDGVHIKNFILSKTDGKYFFIIPKSNLFFISDKSLSKKIKLEFPEIESISIQKDIGILSVSITERKPYSIWCPDKTNTFCYFVSDENVIYKKTGFFSNPLFFVFYTNIESKDNPIFQNVLEQKDFERVLSIKKQLENIGIQTFAYERESLKDGFLKQSFEKFYIKPIDNKNENLPYIHTTTNQSSDEVVSVILTAFKNDKLKNEKDTGFLNTLYIDIRFNNQVSFKLK